FDRAGSGRTSKRTPQAQKRARDDPGEPHGPSGWPSPLASTADSPTFSEKVGTAGRRVFEACAAGWSRYALSKPCGQKEPQGAAQCDNGSPHVRGHAAVATLV